MGDSDRVDGSNHSDDQTVYKKYEVHGGIIFCIELTSTMYRKVTELNHKIQLVEILESLAELMSQLIVTSPNTGIGCYFFQCNKDNSEHGIYEFLPLKDVNAKNMKKLNGLLEDLRFKRATLEEKFPFVPSLDVSLESVLVFLREQFIKEIPNRKAYNNGKVFLFTDNDKPNGYKNLESRSGLRKIVNDLNDCYINFTPFFIDTEEKPFDQSFYSDILKLRAKTDYVNGSGMFDGPNTTPIPASYIKSRVLRKKETRRVKFQCPLILDDRNNFTISIKGYTIISHEKPGTRYKLVYENEQLRKEAFSHRRYLDSSTGVDVSDKVTKIFPYGDENIELSQEDMAKLDKLDPNYNSFLRIIGFRSTDQCLFYYNNVDKTAFVVPDEYTYEGSIRAMASLYRNMRTKGKSAVVWGKLKTNSNPGIYLMTPSTENDPNEGFYLTRIPFIDEIRRFPSVPQYGDVLSSQDYGHMCQATETIIAYFNLRNGYKPSEFKNPGLQHYFSLLHDQLLEAKEESSADEEQESLKDDTLLKLSQIRDKITESSKSDEPGRQRLSKYFKGWNTLYNKEYNQHLSFERGEKKTKR